MITVKADKYEDYIAQEKPFYGSNFDGENYYFYESKEEADTAQAAVLIPTDEPNNEVQDLQTQLDAMKKKLEELLIKLNS